MLLFSGDQDLICNVYGTQYLIGNMTWNGETGFQVWDGHYHDWITTVY